MSATVDGSQPDSGAADGRIAHPRVSTLLPLARKLLQAHLLVLVLR